MNIIINFKIFCCSITYCTYNPDVLALKLYSSHSRFFIKFLKIRFHLVIQSKVLYTSSDSYMIYVPIINISFKIYMFLQQEGFFIIILLLQFIRVENTDKNPLLIDPRTKHTYRKDPKCNKTYRCSQRKRKCCSGSLRFDAKGNLIHCIDHQRHAPSTFSTRQHDMFKELLSKSRNTFAPLNDVFNRVSLRLVRYIFYAVLKM